MNKNIQSKEIFNIFRNNLNFELSYGNYKKILLLMKQEDLSNIVNYINNYINNQDNYLFFIKMILSYYSDICCKTNIQNYNFCLKCIKQNGNTLQYVLEEIKNKYYHIHLEAVKQDGRALQYVSNQYKDDYHINLEAVKENEFVLEHVSDNLLDDKKFIIDCIKINSKCYYYISDKFKNNQDILKLMNDKNISK